MRVILVAVFAALLVVNFADSKKHARKHFKSRKDHKLREHATNDYFASEELQENFVDELIASDELRKDSGTTCSEPMVPGSCKAYLPRWYFDSTTGRCSEFIYGGCGGNSNNFESQDSCQAECEKPCEQSKEIGSGRGLFPRWYFEKSTGKCTLFNYGGSGGNLNNFETEGDCEAKCETEKEISEPQCKQPKKTGDCRAAFKRWYFDSDLQKCEEFIYGGCGENENNFETEQDCQAACGSTAEKKSWKLLGENVCFEAKGDRYGVTHTPSDVVGYLVAVRLQYKSGKVTCSKAANKYSKWGCSGLDNDHWYYGSQYVGVIITNRNNQQILPHVNTNHGFYHVPDFTANSPHLTLRRDKQKPAYVPGKSELRIWYGEDWSNWAEYDNAGKVCADVYGQFYTSCEE